MQLVIKTYCISICFALTTFCVGDFQFGDDNTESTSDSTEGEPDSFEMLYKSISGANSNNEHLKSTLSSLEEILMYITKSEDLPLKSRTTSEKILKSDKALFGTTSKTGDGLLKSISDSSEELLNGTLELNKEYFNLTTHLTTTTKHYKLWPKSKLSESFATNAPLNSTTSDFELLSVAKHNTKSLGNSSDELLESPAHPDKKLFRSTVRVLLKSLTASELIKLAESKVRDTTTVPGFKLLKSPSEYVLITSIGDAELIKSSAETEPTDTTKVSVLELLKSTAEPQLTQSSVEPELRGTTKALGLELFKSTTLSELTQSSVDPELRDATKASELELSKSTSVPELPQFSAKSELGDTTTVSEYEKELFVKGFFSDFYY